MPNIKPISDLRNYSSLLEEEAVGEPVYLTKNGRGKYVIIDIREQEDYEQAKAELKLLQELARGRQSGEAEGWLSEEDIRDHFRSENLRKIRHLFCPCAILLRMKTTGRTVP